MGAGLLPEALAAAERATALDPRSLIIAYNHAMVLMALGRDREARDRCAAALAQSPESYGCVQYVVATNIFLGDLDAAREPMRRLAAQKGPAGVARAERLLDALAGRGDVAAVIAELAVLPYNSVVDDRSDNVLEDHIVAAMLMQLGGHEEALAFLERTSVEGGNTVEWALVLPSFDPVRCMPRFQALFTVIGSQDPHAARVCGG